MNDTEIFEYIKVRGVGFSHRAREHMMGDFILVRGSRARQLQRYANISAEGLGNEMRRMVQMLDPIRCARLLLKTYGDQSITISGIADGSCCIWLFVDRELKSILYVEAWCEASQPRLYIFMNEISPWAYGFINWMGENTSNIRHLHVYRGHRRDALPRP